MGTWSSLLPIGTTHVSFLWYSPYFKLNGCYLWHRHLLFNLNYSIMKKSFSILGAFCLGLFISVSIIACAVDDEYNGNNPSEPTPQEEQVPYVVNIYSENEEFKSVEATYDGDCINGWRVYYEKGSYSATYTFKVSFKDSNSVYIRCIDGNYNKKPKEQIYQCNCNPQKLRSEHINRYNALISQIMMTWHAQLKCLEPVY